MRKHPKSEKFFTAEEKEKLKTTTHEVESRTIGEIAVMVVDHSDHYMEAEVFGSVLLGGLLSLILTVLFFDCSLWFYIPLSFIFFFPYGGCSQADQASGAKHDGENGNSESLHHGPPQVLVGCNLSTT